MQIQAGTDFPFPVIRVVLFLLGRGEGYTFTKGDLCPAFRQRGGGPGATSVSAIF